MPAEEIVANSGLMKISQAAGFLGVSQRTLRYYEQLGLISPARSHGGIRLYSDSDVAQIREILNKVEQGHSLGTITLKESERIDRESSRRAHGVLDSTKSQYPHTLAERHFKIGDVAKHLHTTVRTLRYYEEEGVVKPSRSQGGTRVYSQEDYDAFETAITLTRLGISLDIVKQLACGRSACSTGDQSSQMIAGVLGDLRKSVEEKLAYYAELARDIERANMLVRQCRGCTNAPTKKDCPNCPMERNLDQSRLARLIWDRT